MFAAPGNTLATGKPFIAILVVMAVIVQLLANNLKGDNYEKSNRIHFVNGII